MILKLSSRLWDFQMILSACSCAFAPPRNPRTNHSMGLRDTPRLISMVEGARKNGLDVTTECYPYTANSTSLDFRRRQQKLVQSNRCKTGPGKAVAGRPVASVA